MKQTHEDYGDEMPNHGHMLMEMQPHSGGFSFLTESDFLIEGINIACVEGIVLAIVFTMVVTVLHDSLKIVLHQWGPQSTDISAYKKKEKMVLFVKATIHLMTVFLSYITMLCVMTLNVWLIISVVFGSGIAHLFIRPFLYTKLSNHFGKMNTDIVKEEVKLSQNGNECSAEKKQRCKTENIVTSTCLITDTNNV